MENILVKLKAILNGLTDEELKDYGLWIDCRDDVEAVIIDNKQIMLITNAERINIDGIKYK